MLKHNVNIDTIIYHQYCPDGTAAAWIISQAYPDAILLPMPAGLPTLDVTTLKDKNVIIVDLCPQPAMYIELHQITSRIIIWDHHKTAVIPLGFTDVHTIIDMNRAACQIAWDQIQNSQPRPWVIDYIADRDLWTWVLPNSREINAALFHKSITFETLPDLIAMDSPTVYVELGRILLEVADRETAAIMRKAIPATYKDAPIWLAQKQGDYSTVGNRLCEQSFPDGTMPTFVALWEYSPKDEKWWISLRSKDTDVSIISAAHGGGGHRNAAGFALDFDAIKTTFRPLT